MTYRILTMDKSRWLDSTIDLKDIPIPYQTATQMETQAYAHPEAIQEIVQEYKKDPHFSEVLKASGAIDNQFNQYTIQADGIILFKNYSGYSQICIP